MQAVSVLKLHVIDAIVIKQWEHWIKPKWPKDAKYSLFKLI